MSDLKNGAVGAVVVSEGIPTEVGSEDRKRAGRKVKVLNVKALQKAVNRAESNGPLDSLGHLYAALAADEDYNINSDGVGPIAKRVKAGLDLGLVVQTQAAPKGRAADPNKESASEGITEETANELREAYALFAHPESLEILLEKARKGQKRALRTIGAIESLMHPPVVEAEVGETSDLVPA